MLLLWWLSIKGSCGKSNTKIKDGIIVVPGLGRADRLSIVVENMKYLETTILASKWNCIIYIYADRSVSSFWSMRSELGYLQTMCSIVENTNKRITDNLFMLQPALIKYQYAKVFILFDDIRITGPGTSFDVFELLSIMDRNNLTVVTPLISGANKGGGQEFRNIMQTPMMHGTVGYWSSFLEMFAWVMTMPAYSAVWNMLCPHINPFGWGYDFWYDNYAKVYVRGHKMGIASKRKW